MLKYIYLRDGFINVHYLVGYCQSTIEDYKDMQMRPSFTILTFCTDMPKGHTVCRNKPEYYFSI